MTNNFFDKQASEGAVTALNNAQTSTVPFMGMGENNNPVIVGDVNNTDVEHTYQVEFQYPSLFAINGDFKELPNGDKLVVRTYEQVAITPRKARKMRHAVSTIILSFTKMDRESGVPEIMTFADVAQVNQRLSDELVDALETVLQHTLGISDADMEYVTDTSLLRVVPEIINNNTGFFQ